MTKMEEIFTASQFIMMKCIHNLSDINQNLQDVSPYSAKSNLTFLADNIETLHKLVDAMEKAEFESVGLSDDSDEIETSSSSSWEKEQKQPQNDEVLGVFEGEEGCEDDEEDWGDIFDEDEDFIGTVESSSSSTSTEDR